MDQLARRLMRKPLDDFDLRILQIVLRDARISNQDLAAQIGLSPSACLARLRALEATGLILGYRAILAFEQIGDFHCWVDVALIDECAETIAAFERFVENEHQIVRADFLEGAFQFRLEIVTPDYAAYRLLSERLLACGGVVDQVKRDIIHQAYCTRRSA